MNILEHKISQNSFNNKIEALNLCLLRLNKLISIRHNGNANPCALAHYVGFTQQRVKELSIIFNRLYNNREALLKEDLVWQRATIHGTQSGQLTPEEQEIYSKVQAIDEQIDLDFQTMFLFASMTLEVWALVAGHVFGIKSSEEITFNIIANYEKNMRFPKLWRHHKDAILWLDAFVRLYRNKMIVHKSSLWQIGHSRCVQKLDWSLSIVIAPLSCYEMDDAKKIVSGLNAKIGLLDSENIYGMIYSLLEESSKLTPEQRGTLYKVARNVGFQTPSFQIFAHQIADFLVAATETLTTELNIGSSENKT